MTTRHPQREVLASPVLRRHQLGRDLRQLREARSLRLEDVAAHADVAPSTLSRIQTGKAPTRTSYASTTCKRSEAYVFSSSALRG
jgi:hypothetical protein